MLESVLRKKQSFSRIRAKLGLNGSKIALNGWLKDFHRQGIVNHVLSKPLKAFFEPPFYLPLSI